jgi:vacuolar protein sorting-associated protein 13A/C
MALTINRLGMSLMRMGKAAEDVRFLDDVDLTLSLDSRTSSSQQMTSIEVTAKPIVFRASYRDINLIMTIVNKAIELYGNSQKPVSPAKGGPEESLVAKPLSNKRSKPSMSLSGKSGPQPIGKARVLMSKEQVCQLSQ